MKWNSQTAAVIWYIRKTENFEWPLEHFVRSTRAPKTQNYEQMASPVEIKDTL